MISQFKRVYPELGGKYSQNRFCPVNLVSYCKLYFICNIYAYLELIHQNLVFANTFLNIEDFNNNDSWKIYI